MADGVRLGLIRKVILNMSPKIPDILVSIVKEF